VGIPPDQIEQIFGEYQRLDYAQQRVAGGVGLGLAISERMAMLLGARFIVRSNVNQGSAFGIRLPRTVASKKTELDAHTIHSNYLTGKKAVLLDDHDIALEKLDELLSSWGMDVSVISSINMLQKIADEQGHIDLVISDYHLGLARENGLDILKYAQEMQPSPPPHCVLITGDTTIDLIELTQDLGVHLQHKPMSPTRLRAFLNTLLQNAATETIDKAA
jgi:CheY-like chemotaxis protein